ncbi:hypothetical protein HYQ46_010170 [Verticillium longisporum]|nr:hypothetical protein HYQ46_010170 [Verticillium longisporum]
MFAYAARGQSTVFVSAPREDLKSFVAPITLFPSLSSFKSLACLCNLCFCRRGRDITVGVKTFDRGHKTTEYLDFLGRLQSRADDLGGTC